MGKRQDEELRRLEEALLEEDQPEEDTFAPVWQQEEQDYDVYNTDEADVDLDEYSDEVYENRSGRGLSVLLTMLCMGLLSAFILVLLKYLGVL